MDHLFLQNFLALCASGYYNDCLFHRYHIYFNKFNVEIFQSSFAVFGGQKHQRLHDTDWRPHWNREGRNQYLGQHVRRFIS